LDPSRENAVLTDHRAPAGPDRRATAAVVALLALVCGCTDLDALRALAHGGDSGGPSPDDDDAGEDDAGPSDAGRDAAGRDSGPTPDGGPDAGDGQMPCELATFYRDADEDGLGNPTDTLQACEAPTGYVAVAGDCDDDCSTCVEGNLEICGNSIDDDCDAKLDEAPGTQANCSACGAACAGALACIANECEQPATRLVLGDGKSCAFVGALSSLDAYAAQCWGNNASNELRLGSATVNVQRPTDLPGGNFRDIAVGNDFVCTLDDASDAITCTGANGVMQLGDDDTALDTFTFMRAGTVAISAVFNQGCLLTNAGAVHCWGANFTGDRTGMGTAYPTRQLDLGGAAAAEVSAGNPIGCVRMTSGQVQCWGPLYAGDPWVPHLVPKEDVSPLSGVVQIVTNGAEGAPALHACARLDTGRVACWGVNVYGELGNGASGAVSFQEWAHIIQGDELADVIDVSVGAAHSCALASTGQVYCWGDSKSALGSGTDAVVTPTAIDGLNDVIEVASGASHNCARRRSGQVVCWGYNFHGELGDDTTAERTTVRNVYGMP
jgi:hypothetical protein